MKTDFIVVYDYGMGGLWAVIKARTKEEITRRYPELSVLDSRPNWMTDEQYKQISQDSTFDIDDPPTGWLSTMKNDT